MAASDRRSIPHNLPAELTSFVGREREIAQLRAFLSRARLLTLTGAGGAGKSRLALRVATGALCEFPDGAWIVELASLGDAALVPQTVASGLNIPEQPGRTPTDTLVEALRPRSLLLVLDNCEHLLQACAQLATALLRGCPDLRILMTSRTPLGAPGETLWRVPSLSLPDPARSASLEEIERSEAVRLFIVRARAAGAVLVLTRDNAAAVAHVCRRLDGMPLAIELAAARTKVLSAEQIAARLDDRFRLLTSGNATALPRHQTLRATMDWSYGLLAARERTLLPRLSVFAGGWTLEAAEAIGAGDGVEATDVLDSLSRLVDDSLVIVDTHGGAARYRLLETVRQYGRDRLVETKEAACVRRRHRDWYMALAEEADAGLRGPDEGRWLERLHVEHDNLRVALEFTRADDDDGEAEVRLVRALEWFWHIGGHWAEGRARLEAALQRTGEPSSLLPKVFVGATRLAYRQGDRVHARGFCERGLVMSRRTGDRTGEGCCLLWLGILTMAEGDLERAQPLLEQSLGIYRAIGDQWWTVEALSFLGNLAAMRNDYERATSFHEESLAVARETRNPMNLTTALRNLGHVALRRGQVRRAAECYSDSLAVYKRVNIPGVITECLDGLARVACVRGAYVQAARLFGATEASLEVLGGQLPLWSDVSEHDRHVAATRAALGDAAFAAAREAGRAMTLERVIEYALTVTTGTSAEDQEQGPLTVREREVATLVAQGMTNREIAAALVIAERTAETHVQNILNKLGFDSRTQVAAWAVKRGLGEPATRVNNHRRA